LVELGVFKSRSEAVRALVKIGIEELSDLAVIVDACEKLFELERRLGDIPIRFRGGFKELIEMRERSY
jgi:Arc/MetJ-type ribon-helix-helix transcriptional regulator